MADLTPLTDAQIDALARWSLAVDLGTASMEQWPDGPGVRDVLRALVAEVQESRRTTYEPWGYRWRYRDGGAWAVSRAGSASELDPERYETVELFRKITEGSQ